MAWGVNDPTGVTEDFEIALMLSSAPIDDEYVVTADFEMHLMLSSAISGDEVIGEEVVFGSRDNLSHASLTARNCGSGNNALAMYWMVFAGHLIWVLSFFLRRRTPLRFARPHPDP